MSMSAAEVAGATGAPVSPTTAVAGGAGGGGSGGGSAGSGKPLERTASRASHTGSVGSAGSRSVSDERVEELERLLEAWRQLDLDGQRFKLDQQSLEMTARQDACAASRKELTVATKEFRKLPEEDKGRSFMPLLKRYQEEIDSLTRRSRAAEKAFVSFYRELYVVPDPTAAISSAITDVRRIRVLEEIVHQLESDNTTMEEEMAKLSNQDQTMRELETRLLNMEDDIEAQVTERVQAKEAQLKAAFDKQMENVKAAEENQNARVRAAEEALLQAQRQADEAQSQLFELRTIYDDAQTAHSCELEVLSAELDRAQAALLSEQKQSEMLRTASARRTQTPAADADVEGTGAYAHMHARAMEAEAEVTRQASTIASLSSEVRAWQDTLEKHKTSHAESVERLQTEMTSKNKLVSSLREQLSLRPTVEDLANVKQKLATLQAVYFNVEDDSGDASAAGTAGSDAEGGATAVVMRRVRQLEGQLTKANRKVSEQETALKDLAQQVTSSNESLADQKALVARLEDELRRSGGRAPTIPAGGNSGSLTHESQLLAVLGAPSSPPPASPPTGDLVADPENTSVVAILKGQRDRFRTRMLELESRNDAMQREVSSANERADRLMEDNVKLYEKIKFLESYARVPASVSANQAPEVERDLQAASARSFGVGAALEPPKSTLTRDATKHRRGDGPAAAGAGGDVENQYRKIYEDRVNPFTDFSRRERMKRYSNLSAAEKVTLNTTKFFLSNKFARTFVFFYAMGLHFLVFATLYHFTNVNHHCGPR